MHEVGLVVILTRRLTAHSPERVVGRVQELLAAHGLRAREVARVAPDREAIAEQLAFVADRLHLPVALTLGGTGLHPEDVTPDATLAVLHRPAPGIGEALRTAVVPVDREFMLTRGVAGVRGRTLIVNLPDHPGQLEHCLAVLAPVLPAAIERLRQESDGLPVRWL